MASSFWLGNEDLKACSFGDLRWPVEPSTTQPFNLPTKNSKTSRNLAKERFAWASHKEASKSYFCGGKKHTFPMFHLSWSMVYPMATKLPGENMSICWPPLNMLLCIPNTANMSSEIFVLWQAETNGFLDGSQLFCLGVHIRIAVYILAQERCHEVGRPLFVVGKLRGEQKKEVWLQKVSKKICFRTSWQLLGDSDHCWIHFFLLYHSPSWQSLSQRCKMSMSKLASPRV